MDMAILADRVLCLGDNTKFLDFENETKEEKCEKIKNSCGKATSLSLEETPAKLVVISDRDITYKGQGETIFWKIGSKKIDYYRKGNVTTITGFSKTIFNTILENEKMDPETILNSVCKKYKNISSLLHVDLHRNNF
jgi:hypothetical protein